MKYKIMEPNEILAIIIVLMILGVGVYTFFTVSGSLTKTGGLETPKGNGDMLSASKTIQGWTGAPVGNYLVFVPVTSGFTNTTITKLEALNATTLEWTEFHCTNGTFISGNNTYRVSRRTVNGSTDWTYFRVTYTLPNSATSYYVNHSWKTLRNESTVASNVFNILGIMIVISAIFTIVTTIYIYRRK